MYRVGVVTGTRAEYGLLRPLIQRIHEDSLLELYLIVTGAHLEESFGYTCREIEEDPFPISRKVKMDLVSDTPPGLCRSMGKEMQGMGEALGSAGLDLLILLGDRYEILIAAAAASVFNIPVAHIHGGEITQGAVDDAMRHAITKMSCLHFAATKEYAMRIIQMGEQPERVFHVGALGVESIRDMRFLSREELAERYTKRFLNPYMMVTYHPVTLEGQPAEEQLRALLAVISENPEYNYIFTYANADKGGASINHVTDAFVKEHPNTAVFQSMGRYGYLSALKWAKMTVGNSSSGIIEAPSLRIPSVDIGSRQKGRTSGESVIHCGNEAWEIRAAFQKAAQPEFLFKCRECVNPYEGVRTCEAILEAIKRALEQGICIQKTFYDIGGVQ